MSTDLLMCGVEVERAEKAVAEESRWQENTVPAIIKEYNTSRKKLLEDTLSMLRTYLEPVERASQVAWASRTLLPLSVVAVLIFLGYLLFANLDDQAFRF